MAKYNITCKKEFAAAYGNSAVCNVEADNASAALLEGAKKLGFDTDPCTQTYTLMLEASPVISLSPPIDMLVDELGQLQDQAAALAAQIDTLKTTIKALGAGRYLGSRWQSLVSDVAESKKTDWKAVAAHFNPSHQLITAHSSITPATSKITTTLQKGKA